MCWLGCTFEWVFGRVRWDVSALREPCQVDRGVGSGLYGTRSHEAIKASCSLIEVSPN